MSIYITGDCHGDFNRFATKKFTTPNTISRTMEIPDSQNSDEDLSQNRSHCRTHHASAKHKDEDGVQNKDDLGAPKVGAKSHTWLIPKETSKPIDIRKKKPK